MKTGKWNGVVTAFITMSDAKDEIDWEWPGAKTTEAQSNFFWLGVVPEQTNGKTHDGLTDSYSNYHEYTLDWQPDQLQFLIDGKVVRTVTKDSTGGKYPTTPARIEMSLWPAGIDGSPKGTIEWAGGMIDWSDPDYIAAGHFAALVQSVTVKCTKETGTNANVKNATSYVYGQNGTNNIPGISVTNRSTLLNGAMGGPVEVGRALWMAGAMAVSVALGMSVFA
jgi:beta-glucanase (GH16 family)